MGGEEIFAVVPAMKIAGLKKQGKASVFRDDENFAIHDENVAMETMLGRDASDRIIRVFHSPILHYLLLYDLHQMQAVDQGRGLRGSSPSLAPSASATRLPGQS